MLSAGIGRWNRGPGTGWRAALMFSFDPGSSEPSSVQRGCSGDGRSPTGSHRIESASAGGYRSRTGTHFNVIAVPLATSNTMPLPAPLISL